MLFVLGSFNTNLRPPETFFKVIFWLGYFNSCLNPIIYPCTSREFKQGFIRILRCQCQQRKGWRPYNYRSHMGPANQVYMDSGSVCMNGNHASPSPRIFIRGTGSHTSSGLLPGWSSSSTSLSSSSFPRKFTASPGAVCENSDKSSRMTLLIPDGAPLKEPQHANGQNVKEEVELEINSRLGPEIKL